MNAAETFLSLLRNLTISSQGASEYLFLSSSDLNMLRWFLIDIDLIIFFRNNKKSPKEKS